MMVGGEKIILGQVGGALMTDLNCFEFICHFYYKTENKKKWEKLFSFYRPQTYKNAFRIRVPTIDCRHSRLRKIILRG